MIDVFGRSERPIDFMEYVYLMLDSEIENGRRPYYHTALKLVIYPTRAVAGLSLLVFSSSQLSTRRKFDSMVDGQSTTV